MLLFGAEVIIARQHFLKHLEGWAADLHQEISLNKESLRLEYVNQLKVSDDTTVEEAYQALLSYIRIMNSVKSSKEQQFMVLIGMISAFW